MNSNPGECPNLWMLSEDGRNTIRAILYAERRKILNWLAQGRNVGGYRLDVTLRRAIREATPTGRRKR